MVVEMLSRAVSLSKKSRTPFISIQELPKFCVGKSCRRHNEKLSFDLNQGVQEARFDHNTSVKWEVTSWEPIPAKSNHSLLLQTRRASFWVCKANIPLFLSSLGRTGGGKTVGKGFSAACGIGRKFAHSSLKLIANGQNKNW